jgi:hypothetical protein
MIAGNDPAEYLIVIDDLTAGQRLGDGKFKGIVSEREA